MSEPERLAKRVAALRHCSRADAERYVEGGWVTVDGEVVELPQHRVTTEVVVVDPAARLVDLEPVTILVHQPADIAGPPEALVTPEARWAEDASGERMLRRHFKHLAHVLPLDAGTSGLAILAQDDRVRRRLADASDPIEQEFVVEVSGELVPYGLQRLNRGLSFQGRPLPPCKVSWQNEIRLRFALKGVLPGQLRDVCKQVGLDVVAIRRLRVGTVSLGKMPVGAWRFLAPGLRF